MFCFDIQPSNFQFYISSFLFSIVIVTSKLHEQGVLDFEVLEGNKPSSKKQGRNSAYSNSKLANVHFGLQLAEKTKV